MVVSVGQWLCGIALVEIEGEEDRYIELTEAARALMEAKKVLIESRWEANADS